MQIMRLPSVNIPTRELGDADYAASTRQCETDHTDQESICPERFISWTVKIYIMNRKDLDHEM